MPADKEKRKLINRSVLKTFRAWCKDELNLAQFNIQMRKLRTQAEEEGVYEEGE